MGIFGYSSQAPEGEEVEKLIAHLRNASKKNWSWPKTLRLVASASLDQVHRRGRDLKEQLGDRPVTATVEKAVAEAEEELGEQDEESEQEDSYDDRGVVDENIASERIKFPWECVLIPSPTKIKDRIIYWQPCGKGKRLIVETWDDSSDSFVYELLPGSKVDCSKLTKEDWKQLERVGRKEESSCAKFQKLLWVTCTDTQVTMCCSEFSDGIKLQTKTEFRKKVGNHNANRMMQKYFDDMGLPARGLTPSTVSSRATTPESGFFSSRATSKSRSLSSRATTPSQPASSLPMMKDVERVLEQEGLGRFSTEGKAARKLMPILLEALKQQG